MNFSPLNTVDKLNNWIGRAVSHFVLIIIGIILIEVFLRYVLNRPTMWVHETSEHLFAISFLLGAAYTLAEGGHVRVDLFYRKLTQRGKAILEICTAPFFFLYILVLLYQGGELGWESVMLRERSHNPWAPYIFHVIAMLPVAAFLLFLQGFVQLIRNIKTVVSEREQ